MSVAFPSVEFFLPLQKGLAENPSSTEGIPPSEAYCGFALLRLMTFWSSSVATATP